VPLLYKYLNPDGIKALQTMTLLVSDPANFNDPFEVRPSFDQKRHDYFAKGHETFHARSGFGNSLLQGRSMVGVPVENVVGFGETIVKQFRDELSKRFRALCLCRDPHNTLMWGHYTKSPDRTSYSGLVLGIDVSSENFSTGIKADGFEITYPSDHSRPKLPLACYRFPPVESYDSSGNIANSPDELVESESGILIPFSEYRRQVDEAAIALLTTKAAEWAYEKEVRFLYELPKHKTQLRIENGRHFVPIPPAALREVIVGFRASPDLAEEVVRLFRAGLIGNPQLFYSGCHPNQYEVQKHEATPDYLLDYYKIILPGS
jgi:hypothetical protein